MEMITDFQYSMYLVLIKEIIDIYTELQIMIY